MRWKASSFHMRLGFIFSFTQWRLFTFLNFMNTSDWNNDRWSVKTLLLYLPRLYWKDFIINYFLEVSILFYKDVYEKLEIYYIDLSMFFAEEELVIWFNYHRGTLLLNNSTFYISASVVLLHCFLSWLLLFLASLIKLRFFVPFRKVSSGSMDMLQDIFRAIFVINHLSRGECYSYLICQFPVLNLDKWNWSMMMWLLHCVKMRKSWRFFPLFNCVNEGIIKISSF